jgi:vacuolar protein sorting-associated protein 11
MAPLQIIQILSSNTVTKVGHVRDFLIKMVASEKDEIERNNKLAESYREETRVKREEIDKLLGEPRVVQYAECSSCGQSLDLPAVHFACKHSYHQRCLNSFGIDITSDDSDAQCPKCLDELQGIKAIRKAQEDLADRNDLFFSSLKEGENKFKVLTDFFGRGALTSPFI